MRNGCGLFRRFFHSKKGGKTPNRAFFFDSCPGNRGRNIFMFVLEKDRIRVKNQSQLPAGILRAAYSIGTRVAEEAN